MFRLTQLENGPENGCVRQKSRTQLENGLENSCVSRTERTQLENRSKNGCLRRSGLTQRKNGRKNGCVRYGVPSQRSKSVSSVFSTWRRIGVLQMKSVRSARSVSSKLEPTHRYPSAPYGTMEIWSQKENLRRDRQ